MGAALEEIGIFLSKYLRIAVQWIATMVGINLADRASRAPVATGVLVAWGVLLSVVFTGLSGLELSDIINSNPFSSSGTASIGLICAAFPLHFAIGLIQAYIVFKFTVLKALIVCSRTLDFLFG
jgi:hypothetical protein